MTTSLALNELGQPVGEVVADWQPAAMPDGHRLTGRYGAVEKLDTVRHGVQLFESVMQVPDKDWTYLPYGPFRDETLWLDWLRAIEAGSDPYFYTILDAQGRASGLASLMRITPAAGVIEIGHIHVLAPIQRSPLATEALSLLMAYAFELGNRRLEWKCDAYNARSQAAARRLGFRFEGLFRQAAIVRGRNRDTAWFSLLDGEWPAVRDAHARWLDPANFDETGRQKTSLRELIEAVQGKTASDT